MTGGDHHGGRSGAGVPPRGQPSGGDLHVGDEVEMDIGPVGHGGVCIARVDGRVVFVRYALPGERALVRITEVRPGSYCRGEAIRILRPDPRRVSAPCTHFRPGGCGGCDWQHAAPDLQRELKAAVVAEQLRRLAGISRPVVVEELPGGGVGWRTRVRWAIGASQTHDVAHGRTGADTSTDQAPRVPVIGPRRYRSHAVVPVSEAQPCIIAADGLSRAAAGLSPPAAAEEVTLVADASPAGTAVPAVGYWRGRRPMVARARGGRGRRRGSGRPTGPTVVQRLGGRDFTVAVTGFWQAHRHAAEVYRAVVAEQVDGLLAPGGSSWDLYGGVGVFAALLADLVGVDGTVVSVESDGTAARLARRNLADLPQVRVLAGRVEQVIADMPRHVDAVVLDPPRSGAGRGVCTALTARRPTAIIYVACDPAALARDTAILGRAGYRLDTLRAFDAFPQTHHVECIARFVPGSSTPD